MKIILASNNPGKIKEFKTLMIPFHIQLLAQADAGVNDIEETGLSFVENALLKARHACKTAGLPSIADDSGLVVPSLSGAPGIFSARYAGPEGNSSKNIAKLLKALSDQSLDRHAYFYCALVFMSHDQDPTPLIATGKLEGIITSRPKGESGFGYDPVFYLPDHDKTTAELTPDIKNRISHRGKALQSLMKYFQEKYHECTISQKSD